MLANPIICSHFHKTVEVVSQITWICTSSGGLYGSLKAYAIIGFRTKAIGLCTTSDDVVQNHLSLYQFLKPTKSQGGVYNRLFFRQTYDFIPRPVIYMASWTRVNHGTCITSYGFVRDHASTEHILRHSCALHNQWSTKDEIVTNLVLFYFENQQLLHRLTNFQVLIAAASLVKIPTCSTQYDKIN